MRGRENVYLFLVALLISLAGCIRDKEEPEWCLHPGDALPQFEVTTLGGVVVSSSDSYDARLTIVFFNTTCPDCRKELPILQKQYEDNAKLPQEEQSIYICISREEGEADVERYWKDNNLTLPVSPQCDRRIYSMFASIGIPRVFHARDGIITGSCYPVE
ncbi:MAG: redoxin domain-containing protein [Muribaculaceae bacterium]|nr:redoxin domain-containing protein [Muribaculaceae bacterium]